MNWSQAAEAVKAVAGLAAILGGAVALWQFRRGHRTRRAEWLASLHEQFFETDRYCRVRRVLDYRVDPDYSELTAAVVEKQPHALVDELYRYLNFFELLAGLRSLGQISEREIQILFDYDLRMLQEHPFILAALRPQGFEQLHGLLSSLEPKPTP